jgi:hypothetical protein
MKLKSVIVSLCSLPLLLAACAKPTVSIPAGQRAAQIEGYDSVHKRISADPVAFLKESLTRTREIKEFQTTFLRQERLGVFKELAPQETILADYRDEPFSVRFTWQGDDSEFAQCVYVNGKDDNKVVLLPRKGLLGMPPAVQKFPPKMAVDWKKARNPITDFGPRRMLERVLDGIQQSKKSGGVKITLRSPTEIGPAKEQCYHLELRYPKAPDISVSLQDVYINAKSLVPVGTYLWHEGREERSDETLDAMYLYTQLDPSVRLTDATFEIDPLPAKATAKKGSAKAGTAKTASTNDSGS